MLCLFRFIYYTFCIKSSKSIDSINSQNTLLCLDISYCLNSIQFRCWLVWCIRASLCVLVLSQWNRRWSLVWSLWPHIHLASSLRLNRWRYALVFPCPVSTAVRFVFSVIITYVTEEKTVYRKRKRSIWTKHWLKRRSTYGNGNLIKELELSSPLDYKNYLRMYPSTFRELLELKRPLYRGKTPIWEKQYHRSRDCLPLCTFLRLGSPSKI